MLDLPMVKHRNVESIIVLEDVSDNAVRHYLLLDDGQKSTYFNSGVYRHVDLATLLE